MLPTADSIPEKEITQNASKIPEDQETERDYEDILNMIGFGKSQWIVLFVSGVLLMAVINETMGMSIITIASQCDFQTNSQQKAIMSAATFVGILISSYYWGYLSDTIGRKPVLIKTTLLANAFSLMSMFVSNYWFFVILRFFTGIGLAGASSTVYAFLGEFNTNKNRPIVINYASMFVGISTAYIPAVAWLILPQTWSIPIYDSFDMRPWRLLILFYMIPGFLGALIMCILPETPQLLLSRGKDSEAMKAVQWISETNLGKNSKHLNGIKLTSSVKNSSESLPSKSFGWNFIRLMWQQTSPLFKPPHVLNFLICCVVMFGLFSSSSGMGLWYPEIQNRISTATSEDYQKAICEVIDSFLETQLQNGNSTSVMVCDDTINTKTYIDSILLGLSYVVAYIVLGMIINRLGRKRVLFGALLIAGICGISLHWVQQPMFVVILFCCFLMLPGLCVSVLSGIVVDLIPTYLRGKAVCICLMLGRSGSILGSNVIGSSLESYCSVVFNSFAGFVILCAVLITFLPI